MRNPGVGAVHAALLLSITACTPTFEFLSLVTLGEGSANAPHTCTASAPAADTESPAPHAPPPSESPSAPASTDAPPS